VVYAQLRSQDSQLGVLAPNKDRRIIHKYATELAVPTHPLPSLVENGNPTCCIRLTAKVAGLCPHQVVGAEALAEVALPRASGSE